jgi:hypothetical protein
MAGMKPMMLCLIPPCDKNLPLAIKVPAITRCPAALSVFVQASFFPVHQHDYFFFVSHVQSPQRTIHLLPVTRCKFFRNDAK